MKYKHNNDNNTTKKVNNRPIKKHKMNKLNKGTGAGGKNTNIFGKIFEDKTNNESRLLKNKFIKHTINNTKYGYYLSKKIRNTEIIFVLQNGLKTYMKETYNIDIFRCPDEAYIIKKKNETIIKILEKKEQYVDGSVETKLWSGPSLKREYELSINRTDFKIYYAFSLSAYLKDKLNSNLKKYIILNKILDESNINVFYGDDTDYFKHIDDWIKK